MQPGPVDRLPHSAIGVRRRWPLIKPRSQQTDARQYVVADQVFFGQKILPDQRGAFGKRFGKRKIIIFGRDSGLA